MTDRPFSTADKASSSNGTAPWFLVPIVIVFLLHANHLNVIAEDAYITFRFAQHLVDGHGLVWNIGEPPVEGYTNFLWLLICAAALSLHLDLPTTAQTVGLAAGIGAILCTYLVARRRLALPQTFAYVPAALLALSGPFACWAVSGMEASLFAALIIAAAFWYAGYEESRANHYLALSCGMMLLATLTRPEGLLVSIVLAGASVFRRHRRRELAPAALGIVMLFYFLPVAAYMLWRHQYFGYWLPNTYYAKTGGTLYQYLRGAKYASLFAAYYIVPLALPAICLIVTSQRRDRPRYEPPVAVWLCGAIVFFYSLYIVYVGGDYMAMFRFFVPVLPFVYLLFGVLAYRLWQTTRVSRTARALAFFMAGSIAATGTLAFSTPLENSVYRDIPGLKPSFMHGCFHGVQQERWHVARLKLIGQFFRRYAKPGESLAVTAIGAIGYYSQLPVHSITGIVSPHIAHQTKSQSGLPLGMGFPGHEKEDFRHALTKRPTYIVYLRPERYLTAKPWNLELNPFLPSDYRSRSTWLTDTANKEQGYFSFAALATAPDAEHASCVQPADCTASMRPLVR